MSDWNVDPQNPGWEYRDVGRFARENRPIALIARKTLIEEAIAAGMQRLADEWWGYAAWEYNRRAYGIDVAAPPASEKTKQAVKRAMDRVFNQLAEAP